MKNLSDVDVPLMTHLGDNMWGALLPEEDWPRVNDFPLPGGTPSSANSPKTSQSLAIFLVKWLLMSTHAALIPLMPWLQPPNVRNRCSAETIYRLVHQWNINLLLLANCDGHCSFFFFQTHYMLNNSLNSNYRISNSNKAWQVCQALDFHVFSTCPV